jgi:hypothetical protein
MSADIPEKRRNFVMRLQQEPRDNSPSFIGETMRPFDSAETCGEDESPLHMSQTSKELSFSGKIRERDLRLIPVYT